MERQQNSRLALVGMVVAMLIFGSVGIIAPYTGLQAFELVFVRCVSASVFLGLGWFLSGQMRHEKWDKRELLRVACCGLALVANWICLFRAFELMPVTVAVALYYLAPVLVSLAGVLLLGERLSALALLAIVVCFAGSALVAGIENQSLQSLLSSGPVWALAAAVFYAALTVLGKGVQQLSPYAVACLQTLLGTLLLPMFVNFSAFSGLTPHHWAAILVIGAVHTGLVYYLFFGSIRALPTGLISALVYLDPVAAMVLDICINGFRPSTVQIVGIALMAFGLALSSIATRQRKPQLQESPA